jgi:peptide/nickel transport system substrate-binding protein
VLATYRTGTILSRAAVTAIGDDEYGRNPIGTGPYQLVERIPGQRTVVERNPDFWGDAPQVDVFRFVDIPEESVRADALERGLVDIASFRSPTNIGRLRGTVGVNVAIAFDRPALWTLWVSDHAVPDVRVRQALAYAIDKHELAETVLEFRSNPNVVSYFPAALPGFPSDRTEELYAYDPERSRALLAEAGIAPGQLTLRFPTRTDFAELSQALAGYFQAVGINTELEVQEHALFRNTLSSGGELFDITNVFPSRETATQMLAYFGADIPSNQYEAGAPERVKELYSAQMFEMDPARREQLIQEMLEIIEADLPWIVFGYAASAATAYRDGIDGPFLNYTTEFYLPLEFITVTE